MTKISQGILINQPAMVEPKWWDVIAKPHGRTPRLFVYSTECRGKYCKQDLFPYWYIDLDSIK